MLRNTILIAIPAIIAALAVPASSHCSKGCNCSENVATCDTLDLEPFGEHIFYLKIKHPKVPLILKGGPFNIRGLEKVNSISIENATILEIDKSAFTGIQFLSTLNIVNSNILGITNPSTFANALNLKKLRITNSTLKAFEFVESNSLEELDLSGCKLSEITENTFVKLPNLSYINLGNNKITKIDPMAFSKLIDLEEVNLSNNNISDLHQDIFKNNTELIILNLSFNPLKKFDINYLTGLENLILKSCQLDHFSDKMSEDLFLLNYLDLSSNKINLANATFGKMMDLEYIDLSNNKLNSLDGHIFKSNDRLQKIILDNNNFDTLPKFVCSNGNFETSSFSCKNCNLRSLSLDTFKHLPALVTLDLSHNQLTGVNLTALQYLPTLIELNLSHNQISIINPSSFLKSTGLEKLNLSKNPLIGLDSSLFYNNRALKTLDLSSCGLRHLWTRSVPRNISSLLYLNIADNSFLSISPLDLLVTPSIEVLDISKNPIRCNQLLLDTITWLTERRVTPASDTLNWKTHEALNTIDTANSAEIEYLNNGAPSWRFLAKDRCSEEFYLSTFEQIEELVPVKKEKDTISPPKNNAIEDLNAYYDDFYDEDEYSDESTESNEHDNNYNVHRGKGRQFINDDEFESDLAGQAFESRFFKTQTHSRYSFLWPTLVFVFTALSVLVIAANIMLLMLRSRMIPRHVNLPHIKIPQWSTSGKLKKHSGSVYQPLSEEKFEPCTPIIPRKDYVPTHSSTPKSVV